MLARSAFAHGILVVALLGHGAACARDFVATPNNYRQLVRQLQAGDRLRLEPGVYAHGLAVHDLAGSAERPIVIEGSPGEPPATFIARPNHNTVSIIDSSHVHIRHLRLEGRALPVDAVKAEGHAQWAHHITLEDLAIHGHDHDQQTVAISTKCPAWGWVIRRNVIVGAGTGMYFGNSDGRAPFVAGLIERNLIVDTLGYNLQIKHQQPRPELLSMPSEKSATIIRHNVFSKARYGSKEMARPNVLVGHWPLTGPGADDQYIIYGNFFYQNPHEALFQGEGNIALYNNLFVNHVGDAVRIQPHNDTPRAVDVFYNTVVAAGAGIRLMRREGDLAYPQRIAGNAIFAAKPLANDFADVNVTGGYGEASSYLLRPFAPPGEMDLRPQTRALAQALPGGVALRVYPEWDRDFDGRPSPARFGAYAQHKVSGWLPSLEIKPAPVTR